MINELINYIEEKLKLIEIKIADCDNNLYCISLATELLENFKNFNSWEVFFDNSDFIDTLQEFNLDEHIYNNIILSYNHTKEIYDILKDLGYSTISLDEIDDFLEFKNNIISILTKFIFEKNKIKILRESSRQEQKDYQNLLNILKHKELLDSRSLDLIKFIIDKRCSIEHQTEILMWLNEYNNRININQKSKNRSDELDKQYLEKIHRIFDDDVSIDYFNELLEINISNYKNMTPEEFNKALELMYNQYNDLRKKDYLYFDNHFTIDFFGKYVMGVKETLKKFKIEEELELELFKLEANKEDGDTCDIIEDEIRQIADYQAKINICKKVIDFCFKQDNDKIDNNEEVLDGDILSQSDYEKIINGIIEQKRNIVLFGSLDGTEIKGNFIKQFEHYNNDVKSDLKDIRKVLHYLITTDDVNIISAKESNLILELAKTDHDIKGCLTLRASERADSRFIIKNIAPSVIYVVGMWSKGDEKDYCRVASTIIDKIDFNEIIRQLNGEERNNLIIKNLNYAFDKYNKLCQKINGKNLSNR